MKWAGWYSRKPVLSFVISMLIVALVPLASGWIFYAQSSEVVRIQQEHIVERSLDLTRQELDDDIKALVNLSVALKTKLNTIAMPSTQDFNVDIRLSLHDAIKVLNENTAGAGTFIDAVYLMRSDGSYAITNTSVVDGQTIYERFFSPHNVSQDAFLQMHSVFKTGTLLSIGGKRLVFVCSVSKDYQTGLSDRQLVIVLSQGYFSSLLRDFGQPQIGYALCDASGNVIISREVQPAKDDVTMSLRSLAGSYQLTAKIPKTFLSGNVLMLKVLYFSLLGAMLIVVAFIIYLLSRKTVMPINQIISYIRDNYTMSTGDPIEGLNLIQNAVEQMLDKHKIHEQQLQTYQEQEKMRLLADAFMGLNVQPSDKKNCYVVAAFPLKDGTDTEKVKSVILSTKSAGKHKSCVYLSDALYLLLESRNGVMGADEASQLLENILQSLDNSSHPGCVCAMSMVHTAYDELEMAYREATMAAEYLQRVKDVTVMRFDMIRYRPEYFLRDWQHLDKQLAFARQMGEGDLERAQSTLTTLFPAEFLADSSSVLAQLHLSSLKYQFLHDTDAESLGSTADAEELSRILAREIISCKTHQQLMDLMRQVLEEQRSQSGEKEDERDVQIDEVKSYIRSHFNDKQLSVAAIAQALGLAPNALSQLFSRKANMGVLQYIHKVRIENACNLLLMDPTMNISDIASLVGYTSVLTFNRAFKNRYQITPSEYRRLHNKAE